MCLWPRMDEQLIAVDHVYTAWDTALAAIDTARRAQMESPGLQQPAKETLATWTVTATAEQASLNFPTYLTAYLDACGHTAANQRPDLQQFLPWSASSVDLHT